MKTDTDKGTRLSESFVTGIIAVVFLIVGYQTALFVHNAAVTKIVANRDEPDTVYVTEVLQEMPAAGMDSQPVRKLSPHSLRAETIRKNVPVRTVESFRFDPNTVSIEDLCRLGFTARQAESIDKYRKSGGRFRRKADFKKSYVVSDSIYMRLERYIDIPLVDLNLADSAALDALPGIGGWFAAEIIAHREALGGFSYKEQLMDIYRFDKDKYDGLSDLITVSPAHVRPYPFWSLPADSLRTHPYVRNMETARSIVLYRENNPPEAWTADGLAKEGVIDAEAAVKLSRCVLK